MRARHTQATRRTASAPLCLLLPLLLGLLSPSSLAPPLALAQPPSDPGLYGDEAVVAAPSGFAPSWSSSQAFPDTGFCLTEAEGRVMQNWSSPLYSRRVVMAAEGTSGMPFVRIQQHSAEDSHEMDTVGHAKRAGLVWAWIVKILVQELVGHQVWWYDSGASTDTFYNRLVLDPPERRSDVEIQSYLQPAAPTEDYRLHVTGTGEVVQKGSHSQTNQGGIYLTRSSMVLHPQYAMESWRAFSGGDNALSVDPLYADGALLQLFITDSWATLNSFRDVWGQDMLKEYTGEDVCQPVMVGRDGLPFETGCNDPDYPSMYFPPQCYPNPETQCALIFAMTPVWLGSYMQGQVRTLNLSLGIAFLNVAAFGLEQLSTNPDQLNLIMYSDGNQAPANNDCTFGTKMVPCWYRMQLPTYTSLCADKYNGNYTSPYSCDFPLWQQVKYARKDLVVEAPRVDHFLQQLDLGPADTFWYFQQPELQSGWPQDHKSVACRWIKQATNRARWETWIAPPAACTVADTEFVVSDCDESTAEHTITYSWRQPKACVGGWALPQPEKVSCGYVTTSLSWQVACMAVASVLLLLMAFSTSMRALESVYIWRTSRRAASESLKARAQVGGAKTLMVSPSTRTLPSKSFFARTIDNRRNMPIFALFHVSLYALTGAHMLLLLVPFIQTGTVSESMCWLRYSFTVVAIVTVLQVFASLLATLTSNLNRSLDSSSSAALRRVVVATHVLLVVSMLVVALSGGDDNAFAISTLVQSPGGGSVLLDRCARPVVWMGALHVAVVVLWGVFVAAPLVRVLVRVHFSHLFGTQTRGAFARQKSVAANKRGKVGSGNITRAQLVQANSIAGAFVIWTVASTLLLVPLYNTMEARSLETTLKASSIVQLLGTSLCCVALFGPSWMRAREVARSASSKNNVAAQPGLRMAGMGGVQMTSPKHATQPSVNVSVTNSDVLGDSTNDDRDVTAVSLASVLRDPVLLLHFRRFAECSFDPEPVHFLLQCQTLYRQLKGATLNLTQVLGGLESICDEFIVNGAPQQVNISCTLRDSTLAAVQDMRLSAVAQARNRLKPASAELKAQARACLQEAVSEVYALVQVNSYPRFLNSSALGRSQHLLRWADGFEELDDEEQSAMMTKLRDAYTQALAAAKKFAEDNGSRYEGAAGSAGGGGSGLRKSQEAAVLMHSPPLQPANGVPGSHPVRLPLRVSNASVPTGGGSRSQAPHDTPTYQLRPGECSVSPQLPAAPLAARLGTLPLDSTSTGGGSGCGSGRAPPAHLAIDILSSAAAAAGDTPAASPSLVHEPHPDRPLTLPGSTHP